MLSWVAGCIDAVSYLALGRVFTANMTGNTVVLGVDLAQGHFESLGGAAIALVSFCLGVVVGAGLFKSRRFGKLPLVFGLELLILLIITVLWSQTATQPDAPLIYLFNSLAALAMGIQSIAASRLQVVGISTTYLTGMITSVFTSLVERHSARERQAAKVGLKAKSG